MVRVCSARCWWHISRQLFLRIILERTCCLIRKSMPIEIPISKSVRSSGSTNWPPFIGPASFGSWAACRRPDSPKRRQLCGCGSNSDARVAAAGDPHGVGRARPPCPQKPTGRKAAGKPAPSTRARVHTALETGCTFLGVGFRGRTCGLNEAAVCLECEKDRYCPREFVAGSLTPAMSGSRAVPRRRCVPQLLQAWGLPLYATRTRSRQGRSTGFGVVRIAPDTRAGVYALPHPRAESGAIRTSAPVAGRGPGIFHEKKFCMKNTGDHEPDGRHRWSRSPSPAGMARDLQVVRTHARRHGAARRDRRTHENRPPCRPPIDPPVPSVAASCS